jgi:hypothetical protein
VLQCAHCCHVLTSVMCRELSAAEEGYSAKQRLVDGGLSHNTATPYVVLMHLLWCRELQYCCCASYGAIVQAAALILRCLLHYALQGAVSG